MAETWTVISGYTPQDYTDTAVFEVDSDTKKIALITGQALVAGEENSQYIKFVLDRYWDGIDIKDKDFYVEYALAGQYYGKTAAVNAEYTTEQVRFGWIVPKEACCISGTLLFVLRIESTDYVLKTQIAEHPVFKSVNVEDVVPEPTKEAWYREFEARVETAISDAEAALVAAQEAQTAAENAAENAQTAAGNAETAAAMAQIRYGSPLVAQTADDMLEQNRVYVYTGSETGYTYGHWYYHNGTSWTDGGVYNAVAVDTDTTLSVSGKAADAKATGDAINTLYVTDSASGSVVHFVDGADDVPMKSVVIDTESTSATLTRCGKNLLKNSAMTATISGVTFTVNDDGSVTVNGTNNSSVTINFHLVAGGESGTVFALPEGSYTLSGCPTGGGTGTYFLSLYHHNSGANNYNKFDFGTGQTYELTAENNTGLGVRIGVIRGQTVNNLVFRPMLRLASDTDGTYENYNGSTYDVTLVGGAVQEEIKSLLGINNVWSESGDIECEYRADTKLYIDKRLGV